MNKGDCDSAIADFDQAARIAPNDWKTYYDRGLCYNAKKMYDRAILDFDKAIGLEPKSSWPYNDRGLAYQEKGDFERAIADLEMSVQLDPLSAISHLNRGRLLRQKGEYDRAIADFTQAIALDPKYTNAYRGRGLAYGGKGDFERAVADISEAIRIKPDISGSFSNRAWVLLNAGRAQEAKPDADRAVSLDPKNGSARATRGQILLALGDANAALDEFNDFLRLDDASIQAHWGRGQVYELQEQRSLAVADYKKAVELNAKDRWDKDTQNKARARLIVLEAAPAPMQAAAEPRKPQATGRRVALVIGNAAYKAVTELANPRNDAGAVSGELTRIGFEVIEKHDLDIAAMRRALGEFEDRAQGSEWALVYYSGHGMELNGKNWLIPVDAVLARATDVPDEAMALDRVMERVRMASKLRIVILDACRNNPYRSRMVMSGGITRAVERGFAPVEPNHGEVVFYAARDGSVALDGQGTNSPFAAALVKHMEEDGVELGRFFRRVTSSVLAATNNNQEPFVYGRIPDEDFYFKPPR